MSIPVTASTEAFTPACMAEIEGAPTFRFRHATLIDRHRYHNLVIEQGLRNHTKEELREAIIEQVRAEFEGEGIEQNITKLGTFWAACDEYESALNQHEIMVAEIMEQHEGEGEPELPPEPVLDFPAEDRAGLDAMVDQITAESTRIRKMLQQNHWYSVQMPRLLLRMFLTATSLPVKLKKVDDVLTPDTAEAVINALADEANKLGVSPEIAVSQLQVKAMLSFRLTEDEEKNSSSPRSGSTSPKSSASKQSHGRQTKTTPSSSSDPVTSDEDNGSKSLPLESPARA